MLIDDKTRSRLIMVVWLALMIAIMGLEDLLLWVICWGALGVAIGATAHVYYRRRIRLLGRMETQHQQYLKGDDRGIYGDAWIDHREFNRLIHDVPRKLLCGCLYSDSDLQFRHSCKPELAADSQQDWRK